MFHNMNEWGWGMGGGWIFMLLFLVVVVLGIAVAVKWLAGTPRTNGTPPPKTAKQILEERFARGEIDEEEFGQKKRDLEQ